MTRLTSGTGLALYGITRASLGNTLINRISTWHTEFQLFLLFAPVAATLALEKHIGVGPDILVAILADGITGAHLLTQGAYLALVLGSVLKDAVFAIATGFRVGLAPLDTRYLGSGFGFFLLLILVLILLVFVLVFVLILLVFLGRKHVRQGGSLYFYQSTITHAYVKRHRVLKY